VRFVAKLSYLPAVPELSKSTLSCAGFDGRVLLCNDHIAGAAGIEELDDSLAEEPRVAANADTRTTDLFWNLSQAEFQERDNSSAGASVSRSQRPMPELLQMSLEAEERMIGASSPFLGIVPNAGKLELAVNGENYRIEIERQSSSGFGQRKQLGTKLIVQCDQLANGLRRKSPEKTTQRRLVWKAREPQQGEEGAVVLQNLCLVDASQACHDGIQKDENHVAGKVVEIALRHFDVVLK